MKPRSFRTAFTVSDMDRSVAFYRDLLGFQLRLAQVTMYRDWSAAMTNLNLTQRQGAVLMLIAANPGASQVDLAATLGADRATMMAIVDRLQDRRLVVRRRSLGDRRRQELHLTEVGVKTLAQMKANISEHEARFTSRFTKDELEALTDYLRRIHQQL